MANNTDVGSLEQGQITITPTSKDEYVENCYDLVEDTAVFTSAIDEVVNLATAGTKTITLTTVPADATITAVSDTTGTATATVSDGVLTITGVASGSAIVTLTASKTNYASFERSILVIVE